MAEVDIVLEIPFELVLVLERCQEPAVQRGCERKAEHDHQHNRELHLVLMNRDQGREHQLHEERCEKRLDRRIRHRNAKLARRWQTSRRWRAQAGTIDARSLHSLWTRTA